MKLTTLIILSLLSSNLLADEAFISSVSYSGSGCQEETAITVLSPDQSAISLMFEDFLLEVGGENPMSDRKNCQVKINISVPQDKQIVITKIDYRGYAFAPNSASINLGTGYSIEVPSISFATPEFKNNMIKRGYFDDEFLFEQVISDRLLEKACGRDLTLNVKASLSAQTRGEESLASIDSLDSGIDYKISLVDCTPTIHRSSAQIRTREQLRQQALIRNRRDIARRRSLQETRTRAGVPLPCHRDPQCVAARERNRERMREQMREQMRREHSSRTISRPSRPTQPTRTRNQQRGSRRPGRRVIR